MVACGLCDLKAYLRRLQTSTQEFDALIEKIVAPETGFFAIALFGAAGERANAALSCDRKLGAQSIKLF
jgi:hypothetical protein